MHSYGLHMLQTFALAHPVALASRDRCTEIKTSMQAAERTIFSFQASSVEACV